MGFIDSYIETCKGMETSEVFDLWGGIACVAAAMGSRCYIRGTPMMQPLHPNLYTMLVARTSLCKKSTAVTAAADLARDAFNPEVIAQAAHPKAIISMISRVSTATGRGEVFINSDEFSVFLGPDTKKTGILEVLTTLYDRTTFKYFTLARGREPAEHVSVNMLCGSTVDNLKTCIPPIAVRGGFLARIVLVYGREPKGRYSRPVFTETGLDMRGTLVEKLASISKLEGEFTFSPKAGSLYDSIYTELAEEEDGEDRTLLSYKARRSVLLKKLSMILSAAAGNTLVIEETDVATAWSLVKQVDTMAPTVCKLLSTSELGEYAKDVFYYVVRFKTRTRGEIVRRFSHTDGGVRRLNEALQALTEGGLLWVDAAGKGLVYRVAPDIEDLKKGGLLE